MNQPPCRFGILGTANIARKNWHAIRNSGNATLVAVASRDRMKAQRFIDECQSQVPFPQAPLACGGYQELLDRKDVDAVYIPLPTGIRKEWVIRAAEAKKHVLCEKPCGASVQEVKEMLQACEKNGVQFMDGVMFMHSKRLPLLRQVLDDGRSVGQVKRINSTFSFFGGDDFLKQNIRVSNSLEPLGCLGDLGWYNIRFSLWVMNYRMPESVTGRLIQHTGDPQTGVPLEFSAELFFPAGVSAHFYCSFMTANQQAASISGTQGHANLQDFVLPFHGCESRFGVTNAFFRIDTCLFSMEDHTRVFVAPEYSSNMPDAQEANMVRAFADIALSKKLQPQWGEIALKTQQVMEACLQSAREGKPVSLRS
jgi:predicted dehydrogenase